MNGLGGLNKSRNGVVIGLVQLKLLEITTRADVTRQTERIVAMVGKAKRGMPTIDLVVFPEYASHGLSMDIHDEILCDLDGPEVAAFKGVRVEHKVWGCFSIMERNPGGMPYNSGLIIDDAGDLKLYYRKLHPWVPVEPWEPGDLGIPVINGPNGCKLALIICHDGMFPEMAREAAYKGAEVMLRTAGYIPPVREAWRFTNQSNAFCNLMVTASVCMCGSDGTYDSMGEAMFCDFDGTIIAQGGAGRLGCGEQYLSVRASRLCRGQGRCRRLSLQLHERPPGRPLSPAVGGYGAGDRLHQLRATAPTRLYGKPVPKAAE